LNELIQKTVTELDAWEKALKAALPNAGQTLNQTYGWNMPSVSRDDLVVRIDTVRDKLAALPDETSSLLRAELEESPARLSWVRSNVLPNIAGGHAGVVVDQIFQELDRLERAMAPSLLPEWEKLASDGLLPRKLTARLRAVEARLLELEPRSGELEQKIRLIDDATASAEQLPTDLATLAEGRDQVASTRRQVDGMATKVTTSVKEAETALREIKNVASESEKLFERLEDIYKAGSTKGLASAFSKKAEALNASLYLWVVILIVDLIAGAWIGAERFKVMQAILQAAMTPTAFWANFAFSLLSVAGPVWLGWVATKQINQRFKLAEDYSFKASVASAYEGYKSEAVRLDPAFEKRLFSSALTRLEEAPLRFVDTENFGTPWHELTSSPAFTKALELVPDLKGTVASIVSSATGAAAGAATMFKVAEAKSTLQSRDKSSDDSDRNDL
jgi:hypothetical protein